jgi:hypothetical protein
MAVGTVSRLRMSAVRARAGPRPHLGPPGHAPRRAFPSKLEDGGQVSSCSLIRSAEPLPLGPSPVAYKEVSAG